MKLLDKKKILVAIAALAASTSLAKEVEISQKGKAFLQNKMPVKSVKASVGDTLVFRNDDPFFHNVFSSSTVTSFDLGSFPQGQLRKVTLEKAGVVEVECAIHPEMKLRVEVGK